MTPNACEMFGVLLSDVLVGGIARVGSGECGEVQLCKLILGPVQHG